MNRVPVVVAVWVLYGGSALVMFAWPGLVGAVSQACDGRTALDVRGHWTVVDARELVQACGTDGRAAYLRLELFDLVYPLISGLALLLAASLLVRRMPDRRWRLLLVPAVAMTVLDYGENATVWSILATWPTVGELPAQFGGVATLGKQAAGLAAYLAIPLLLLAARVGRLRSRARAAVADSFEERTRPS